MQTQVYGLTHCPLQRGIAHPLDVDHVAETVLVDVRGAHGSPNVWLTASCTSTKLVEPSVFRVTGRASCRPLLRQELWKVGSGHRRSGRDVLGVKGIVEESAEGLGFAQATISWMDWWAH